LSARTLFWHEGSSEWDSTCLKCCLTQANISGALCRIYINLLDRRNRGSSISVVTRPLAERRSSPHSIPGRVKKFFSKQCISHCFPFFISHRFILPTLPEGRAGIAWDTSKPLFPCSKGSVCYNSSTPFFLFPFISVLFFFAFLLPCAFQANLYFKR
jgi:hypothetical protein